MTSNIKSKTEKVLLCSLSMMFGGVEIRMAKEAALLSKNGLDVKIAINFHSALSEWLKICKLDNLQVIDFDPPPIFEQFIWRNKLSLGSRRVFSKFRAEYKAWQIVRLKNMVFARQKGNPIFKHYKPDLMHIFIPWSGFEGTRLWLAHNFKVPVILSIRNAFFDEIKWTQWEYRHYKKAFRSVFGIYAISEGALDCFSEHYGDFICPKTKIEVIHNSVDTDKFRYSETLRSKARKKFALSDDALVMGFVGRLEKQKRPEAVVNLFIRLKSSFTNLYLLMVGSGPLEEKVRNIAAKAGMEDFVIITGWQKSVEEIIPAFDVGVQLSNNEGFGTSTAEIMACGVPVLATDVQGTHDILKYGRGGILVPLECDDRLSLECSKILSHKSLRRKIGFDARKEVQSRFSDNAWNGKILSFYDEVFNIIKNQGKSESRKYIL